MAERCELPVSFSISSPTRWDHDILGDQHRMLGPKTGWGIGSPPSLGMPTFTSPSSPCFTPGCLPGPIIVDDEDETEDDDLWLAPMADFQAPSSDLPWHLSPSPDTSSGTSLSSLFAATATTTTTATALPSSSPPMDSSRPCDRRTLELIHFFFNILSPCLLSSSSPTEADNPWRRLILPLTYGSEPLRSAVCAISSAHLETIGAVSSRASGGYRERAVEELAKLMEEKLGSVATSLSTTLLLIHYDSVSVPCRGFVCQGVLVANVLRVIR